MSKLTDRLNEELHSYGLREYPIARRIAQIVREANRPWWRFYAVSVLVAFVAGIGLVGVPLWGYLDAIRGTTAKWYKDCTDRFPGPKVTTKAQVNDDAWRREKENARERP
jgi:hypothetical protein